MQNDKQKEIGFYIDRTYKVVRQDLINQFRKANLSITPEQWILLSRLHESGPLFQKDLANRSFKDSPTVSRIVDLLVEKGFVTKKSDDSDGRRFLISLTQNGHELVEQAMPHVLASRSIGWKRLSDTEYDQLINILNKIFENYQSEL
jgi:DNA-binding MarR family transcriptional regulator